MGPSRRKCLIGLAAAAATPVLSGTGLAAPLPGADRPNAAGIRGMAGLPARGDITSGQAATITRIATQQPLVALTFDDGPHARLTAPLLDILKAHGVPATFYVVGHRVARHPDLVRRMADEGHEVGNHTWSHPMLSMQSDATILNQIDRTSHAVIHATGRMPVTLRPPWGELTYRQRLMVFRQRGMPSVLWSVDPEDWRRPGQSVVAQRIVSLSQPGDVVLAHDIHGGTVRAMPAAIEGLKARGFRFVTVSELIGWPRWQERRLRTARG